MEQLEQQSVGQLEDLCTFLPSSSAMVRVCRHGRRVFTQAFPIQTFDGEKLWNHGRFEEMRETGLPNDSLCAGFVMEGLFA